MSILGSRSSNPNTINRGRQGRVYSREILVLSTAASIYFGVRVLVEGSRSLATRNAERLLDIESMFGLDVEREVQRFALEHDWARAIGNVSYVWLHWPLLIGVLGFLFCRDRSHYRQVRNAMFISGAIGLVLFWAVPMAPPRFMPGFIGTVTDDARRHYLDYPLTWTNQYAAFPSYHVGWTLIACLAMAAALHSRAAKGAALLPSLLVGVAVVTTGNHYIIDSLTGAAVALAAYVAMGRVVHVKDAPIVSAAADVSPEVNPSREDRQAVFVGVE